MKIDNNTKFQSLASHYKDSFELIKGDVARRDRYFILMLVLLTVMIFQIFSPDIADEIITALIKTQLELELALDTSAIDTILWFSLLGLGHTYFQTVLHVERQYSYIYQLEEALNKSFKDMSFTREGKTYEKHKYSFSKWTKFIFWNLFPFFLITIIVSKLYIEYNLHAAPPVNFYANLVIAASLLTSTYLYLRGLYRKK